MADADTKAAAEALKKAGNDAFTAQQYDRAIESYTEAIKLDGTNPIYYSNRSACYGAKGEWEQAAADAKQCIEIDPNFVKGYWRLATAHTELKQFDEAQEVLMKAMEKDPDNQELIKQLRLVRAKKASATNAKQPTRVLDAAAQQEFAELKDQLQTHARDLQQVKYKLAAVSREERIETLTASEVKTMPTDTPLYRSIGRMYMLSSHDEVEAASAKKLETLRKQQSDLSGRQEYLQRRVASTEANIQDLLKG